MNSEWVRMPVEVMADKRLTGLSAFVYAIMLDKVVGETAHINAKEIADKIQKDHRSVRRAVKQLKECGYITNVKKSLGDDVYYTLKVVLPEKKRSKKQETPAQSEQLSFETTEKGGTLEGDITPEQYRLLCELIASKLSGNVSSERCDKLLRGEYVKAKTSAKTRIDNFYAYLKKMISNWKAEQEVQAQPESDFDVSQYEVCRLWDELQMLESSKDKDEWTEDTHRYVENLKQKIAKLEKAYT